MNKMIITLVDTLLVCTLIGLISNLIMYRKIIKKTPKKFVKAIKELNNLSGKWFAFYFIIFIISLIAKIIVQCV